MIVLVVLGVLGLGVFMLISFAVSRYNMTVGMDESVKGAWSQVENVYQRRADLVPNLVNTVKGAADFERQTLTDDIEARSRATAVSIDPTNISPAMVQQFQAAQEGLSGALSRLLVTIERYPTLTATANFADLQAQLGGTENRISFERKKCNDTVISYNTLIRTFPNSLIAGFGGFFPKGYFTANAGADQAPAVNFGE